MQGIFDLMSDEGINHSQRLNMISRSGRISSAGAIAKLGDMSLWQDAWEGITGVSRMAG